MADLSAPAPQVSCESLRDPRRAQPRVALFTVEISLVIGATMNTAYFYSANVHLGTATDVQGRRLQTD